MMRDQSLRLSDLADLGTLVDSSLLLGLELLVSCRSLVTTAYSPGSTEASRLARSTRGYRQW
jgi:hypothetical protein